MKASALFRRELSLTRAPYCTIVDRIGRQHVGVANQEEAAYARGTGTMLNL